jgi:ribosomal protein S18 acetylase RimI-like enzyme
MQVHDIPAVVALGSTLFSAEQAPTLYRCWDEAEVLRVYQAFKETCLVAVQAELVLGFALGSILEKPGSPWRYGWLEWLAVAPRHKRHRIATRLVKQLQNRFVERKVRIMLADTYEGNHRALGFFRKFGFGQEQRHVYLSLNLDTHQDALDRRYGED